MNYIKVKNLLAKGDTNAKTIKNSVKTYIMYLAPADASGVMNTCPFASKGCTQSCLFTSGFASVYASVNESRINKTKYFHYDRQLFLEQLAQEILDVWSKRGEGQIAIRLNGTSDIDFLDLIKRYVGIDFLDATYEDILFYDYTKNPNSIRKYLGSRYRLTFSRSESNDHLVEKVLSLGGNVAMVFSGKVLPSEYLGYKVINGDESDLRYFDESNVIVGLKAKGKAKKDTSGFVITL